MHSDTKKALLNSPNMLESYIGPVVEPEPWTQYGLFTGDVVDVPTLANSFDVYLDKAEADAFYEGEIEAFREAILVSSHWQELYYIWDLTILFDRKMVDFVPMWLEEPTAKRLMHCHEVRAHAHAVWRDTWNTVATEHPVFSIPRAHMTQVGTMPKKGGADAPYSAEHHQESKAVVGQS